MRVDLAVDEHELDLVALADEIGLRGTVNDRNRYDASVHVSVEDVVETYGPWPGAVPSVPPSLGTGS